MSLSWLTMSLTFHTLVALLCQLKIGQLGFWSFSNFASPTIGSLEVGVLQCLQFTFQHLGCNFDIVIAVRALVSATLSIDC